MRPGRRLAHRTWIARVARVADINAYLVRYDFVVEKRLAGDDRKEFSISGRAPDRFPERGESPGHNDAQFWERGGGRAINDTDCVVPPTSRLGESYLVFLNQTATWRSFERIDRSAGKPYSHDKWYAYVEQKLRARAAEQGRK